MQGFAVLQTLVKHCQGLVQTYHVDTQLFRFEQYVATVLFIHFSAHRLLNLRLLVAVGILGRKLYLLAHHEFALRHTRISASEERTVFHRQSVEGIFSLYVEYVSLVIVLQSFQSEIILGYLLQHIVNAVVCRGCESHKYETNGD